MTNMQVNATFSFFNGEVIICNTRLTVDNHVIIVHSIEWKVIHLSIEFGTTYMCWLDNR